MSTSTLSETIADTQILYVFKFKNIMQLEWFLRQPREGLTKCHFPTIPVLYPTSFRPSAIVVSFRGSPIYTLLYTQHNIYCTYFKYFMHGKR